MPNKVDHRHTCCMRHRTQMQHCPSKLRSMIVSTKPSIKAFSIENHQLKTWAKPTSARRHRVIWAMIPYSFTKERTRTYSLRCRRVAEAGRSVSLLTKWNWYMDKTIAHHMKTTFSIALRIMSTQMLIMDMSLLAVILNRVRWAKGWAAWARTRSHPPHRVTALENTRWAMA